MNYICTWFCADRKGDESRYLQTGELSSSARHQNIYWKCIVTFFMTSLYFNPLEKHIFFTNVLSLPKIKGCHVKEVLQNLGVEIIHVPVRYKTPTSYYHSWAGQFYEFSIFNHIAQNFNTEDRFLLLDSDCIFTGKTGVLFDKAESNKGFLSYVIDYDPSRKVNGLSRFDLHAIYENLLVKKVDEIPQYHAGEFFLCNVENIKIISEDFIKLWPKLMKRNLDGLSKFNEEAQTLSYLFYKNNFIGGGANSYIRRIWTNPVFYRNTDSSDQKLILWHLPSEKQFGIRKLYKHFVKTSFHLNYSNQEFSTLLDQNIGLFNLDYKRKISYYLRTYSNAMVRYLRNGHKKNG